MEMHWFERKTS